MVNLNHYYKKQQYWQHKQQLKEERLIDSTQLNEQRKHDNISGQKPMGKTKQLIPTMLAQTIIFDTKVVNQTKHGNNNVFNQVHSTHIFLNEEIGQPNLIDQLSTCYHSLLL